MSAAPFAIMDVETTHGDPRQGRIMEVAIVLHDGRSAVDRWHSLIDPREPIPPFIRQLTGLREHMLKGAPTFARIARMIDGFTRDRIVVAHNTRYDLTALDHEFARTGLRYDRDTLCTEQLCRRLLPQLAHHNLGSMCRYFGIPFEVAHRAMSDAEATAALLGALMNRFGAAELLGPHRRLRLSA
ncbi:MAG: 3'-5' exonuclease [Flavobacteriales bacterium]|nr:3'-5' exonuclease [Flavobacteriales bacterium]